ncbi:transglutaminase domain-containing protein [Alicyclobacillus cycloheptanicus]|uniref:Transglutaminase-like putative cysteine protease n=1 Tax=Alicyclobacillus cycloheptanicus TaxID=1457 RepID=A0ABT9XLI2_9BACL|nr:transglutaminase domain-containing protein [Alicyclobacillus cycloheptanicus]MDQ0191169.1 transglutaminase-like putative cysteine protease [Alicyclobacillus cycloheptanicus]WDM02017.1 transglutaminase domain-containing protein [Alicyclobacillus cycloheptanicus]
MPRGADSSPNIVFRLFIAVAAAVWLWVFLPPMQQLGLLVNPRSFAWVIFGVFVLAQLVQSRWFRLAAGVLGTVAYMWRYFRPSHTGAWRGLLGLLREEGLQVYGLLRHTTGFQDPLQTQLFLLSLLGIFWLLTYAARRKRLWIFYNALAVLVLGAIDANTGVHPNAALVVLLLDCVCVLGMTRYAQMRSSLIQSGSPSLRFFVPFAIVCAVLFGVSLALPDEPAVWANPFSPSASGSLSVQAVSGATEKVIGYQMDDAHLGGSFTMSDTQVLSVIAAQPAYLQGQVLNVYTGKGWLPGSFASAVVPLNQNVYNPQSTFAASLPTQVVQQKVTVLHGGLNVPVLFGAYAIQQVNDIRSGSAGHGGAGASASIVLDDSSGSLSGSPLQPDEQYVVTSRELADPTDVLMSQPPLPADPTSLYPASVTQDLALPSSVPARVRDLAKQITADDATEYGKVTSVMSYLQSFETYNTQDIPVPGPGQDYVDQFLFETHQGYCNNFASAMAVLLRAVDIPTRFVTGFTQGTEDYAYQGPGERFIIENQDAHAWVQVYFPKLGWIPFDPTPGFNMPFSQGTTSPASSPAVNSTPAAPTPPKTKVQPAPANTSSVSAVNVTRWMQLAGLVLAGLLALLAALAWVFRRRILLFRAERLWRADSPAGMTRGMHYLIKLLAARGRLGGVVFSVRDLYQAALATELPEDEVRHFLTTAEAAWYGPGAPSAQDVARARQTWKRWIAALLQQGRPGRRKRSRNSSSL